LQVQGWPRLHRALKASKTLSQIKTKGWRCSSGVESMHKALVRSPALQIHIVPSENLWAEN
jgi:hypothetical protein